ncbi:MAG: hypothetical protein LBB75_10255 [Oscillospiraceae bacterium]|jgi:hypothetical protein|nr:hypothetical protein [Oscillospiraceae bacterium]
MLKKLCAALLCLLMAAGLWGCGKDEEFTEIVTKIDLAAPGSQKYRDWLEEYYASGTGGREAIEPTSIGPKTDKPDMNASKEELIFLVKGEGPAKESWKTWDWTDAWELEAYSFRRDVGGWYVLRVRSKITGETQIIDEAAGDVVESFGCGFEMVHIDEAYVVYSFGDNESWSYWFYAPRYGEGQRIDRGSMPKGFLDETHTKWWYREYANAGDASELDYSELDGEERAREWHRMFDSVLYYLDLRKLAAGDADARREIIRGANQCTNAWMAERGGRSVMCFYVMTGDPYSRERDWGDPYYIGIYDPQEDRIQEYLETPNLNWCETVAVLPNRFYTFKEAYTVSEEGKRMPAFDSIDFYVINL